MRAETNWQIGDVMDESTAATGSSAVRFPKISVVTTNYNQNPAFLEETIKSVLNQGYPNLEYIVMDGGSTDRSNIEIIKQYGDQLAYWQSCKDEGHFHAINDGLQRSTGEIMAWLNSDDCYLPWCFSVVADIFSAHREVEWLTTIFPMWLNQFGQAINVINMEGFNREYFYKGDNLPDGNSNGFARLYIQQESTFWRRSLWERAGARLDTRYNLAADFELWARFYKLAELYGVVVPLSTFRVQPRQKTSLRRQEYADQCRSILGDYGGHSPGKFELWYRKHLNWRLPMRLQKYYPVKVFRYEKHDSESWSLHTISRL